MKLQESRKEYNPYYDLYLKNLSSNDECFERLNLNLKSVFQFFKDINEDKMGYTYSADKWNIAQILQHIIDTERIFCYRALKIVREVQPEIQSYDHEAYAQNATYKSKASLLNDYKNNRNASISLFQTFADEDLLKSVNFGNYQFKVGLIPFIFCGHELHHLQVIKDFYLEENN
ncbi:DinB family protein [Flavobacteriaceae bacterium 14752]|uniref:DinB family protein n=1 Tax=Mesohalobacter salilacus TaxID=2491711 RepID=UPI000F63BA27|nr:DinB family protein [Flavobacteriaceae bacterium 14752]